MDVAASLDFGIASRSVVKEPAIAQMESSTTKVNA
jgi:hypothetical protein